MIYAALITGLRRGELLNTIWADVDFAAETIDVAAKGSTAETWEWPIKDTDRRTLPFTEEAVLRLPEHQSQRPEKHPHLFAPPQRYGKIQELGKQGNWNLSDVRLKAINNFRRNFETIQKRALSKSGALTI